MKIELPRPTKVCHCYGAKIDLESETELDEGFQRLRRSDAPTPLRRHLRARVFYLLRSKTTRLGATLLDAVRVGLRHHDARVGAVLPDQFACDDFQALFAPLLAERHLGFDVTSCSDSQPPITWGDWRHIDALDPKRKFVERVSVSASRNLDVFRFTPTMTPQELQQVEDRIILTLFKLPGEYQGRYEYIQCLNKARRDDLQRDRCLFNCGDKYDHASNVPRFWSYGRGVFVNESRSFVVWVNAKDHLRVIAQERGGDLKNAYRRLANVMPYVDCRLRSARHPRLGHLTVNPDDVGSALTVEADVRTHAKDSESCSKELENVARVYHMEIQKVEDDLYRVTSRSRLGFTEFELMKEFSHGLRELLYMINFFEPKQSMGEEEYDKEG